MPPTGAHTDQDSSATVLPESTTLSSWSVLSVEPGKLKIHGELDGERLDISDLPVEILAEFASTQVSSLNDDLITTIQSKPLLHITLISYLLSYLWRSREANNIFTRTKDLGMFLFIDIWCVVVIIMVNFISSTKHI